MVGGALAGEHELSHRHAQAKAGARLAVGGLSATPSLSLFSGSLDQGGYTAESAALRAEVPGYSQGYRGWKLGLDLAPTDWLEGPEALRWRPSLHVGTRRTHSDSPSSLRVHQSDKAGVLSFASDARAQSLPRAVHSFGVGVTALRSQSWRLQAGYAGMVVDGEPHHGLMVRGQVRF